MPTFVGMTRCSVTWSLFSASVLRLHQPIAVAAAGQEAILDRGFGVQFTHKEQSNHEQQEGDSDASETRGLPVGFFLLLLLFFSPRALSHTDGYLTAF